MTSSSNALRITPRLIIGLAILALGILWTLDNMDLIESEPITDWWPAVLILIGVIRLLDPKASRAPSAVLIILGTLILIAKFTRFDWDLGDLIPLGIAAIGGKLAWDALARRQTAARSDDPSSVVHAFAIMAGVNRVITSQAFRGGDANAIMGGVELDLSTAKLAEGEPVVIDAFAMWGGVEITVPDDWRITSEVLPILGGFDDKTINRSAAGPVLVIRGAAVMGAIVVKNADASRPR